MSKEHGESLAVIADAVQSLAASLPHESRLEFHYWHRELTVTIFTPGVRDGWRFVYRIHPGESSEYHREQLANYWQAAMRKLGVDSPRPE